MFKRQEIKYYGQIQQITSSSLHINANIKQALTKSLNKAKKKELIPHSADRKQNFEQSSARKQLLSAQKHKLKIKNSSPEVPQLKNSQKLSTNSKNAHLSKMYNKSIAQNSRQYLLRIKTQQKVSEINMNSRIILIDWLIQVTLEFNISKEALYQAIYYLDRLAQKAYISKSQYQCVGLSCLFLSHKIDTHKHLSFSVASNLVEGSRPQTWFMENQQRMLKMLQFRLNPFTLWQQINMVIVGFQIFFKNQIASLQSWDLIKRKILWTAEGIIMGKFQNSRKVFQKDLCIGIICLVVEELVSNQYISEKKLKLFCKSLLDSQSCQQLVDIQNSINYWRSVICDCSSPYNPQIYHPQLKLFAGKA